MRRFRESGGGTDVGGRSVTKNVSDLRHLLKLVWPERATLAVAVVASLLVAGASVAQPALVATVISDVRAGEPILATAGVLAGCIFIATAFATLQGFILQIAGERVVLRQRKQLLDHIGHLTIGALDGQRYGDLVSRVSSDTSVVRQIMGQGLVGILGGAFTFVFAVVAMLAIDPVLFALAVGIAVTSILTAAVVARRVKSVSRDVQQRVGQLAAGLYRYLGAVRTVRAADATRREVEQMSTHAREAYGQGVRAARAQSLVAPLSGLTSQVAVLVVLGVGGARFAAGQLSIEGLVAFFLYLFMMITPLSQLFSTMASVNSALGAVQRIREVLALPVEPGGDGGLRLVVEPAAPAAAIRFDNVTFSYTARTLPEPEQPSQQTATLHGLSFTIPHGSRTAIVGPSGAGKSTVFALIERFYSPEAGQILLRGHALDDLPLGELRRHVGYVEQDAPILSGTIMENLRLGSPGASAAECVDVLRAVNLDGLAEDEASLLALNVGEAGVLLSGGEKQRLALARTLLADPRILLLDEVSSSLDAGNELATHEAIERAADGRTVVVIAHRLVTVQAADQIIVLNGGRVEATGTHAELLATSTLYQELASSQLHSTR